MVRLGADVDSEVESNKVPGFVVARKTFYHIVQEKRYRVGVDVHIKEYNMARIGQSFWGNDREFKELLDNDTGDETSSEED